MPADCDNAGFVRDKGTQVCKNTCMKAEGYHLVAEGKACKGMDLEHMYEGCEKLEDCNRHTRNVKRKSYTGFLFNASTKHCIPCFDIGTEDREIPGESVYGLGSDANG